MSASTPPPAIASSRKWYQVIGPGLITACVVIGPGSILTSSKVGAANGYSMIWVILVSVIFMSVFMTMSARIGVVSDKSCGQLVTERVGRWFAILIGIGVFFISAAYQFGNNLGVKSAFDSFENIFPENLTPWLVVGFNALSITFLFAFKNIYRAIEKLMMCFVALMLISFFINLSFAKPDLLELVKGIFPGKGGLTDISVLGLIGTTFVTSAAYYQAYLSQQKGWNADDLKTGMIDARVGAVLMALITLMIMSTAAAELAGQKLSHVKDVASGLEPAFGTKGKVIFCMGLFAAAYSSFLVNSMIAGYILSDGLGLGYKATDLAPKVLTTVVLLTGMSVALIVSGTGFNPIPAIVAAQAVTVIAAPLLGGVLLWLSNDRTVMGDHRNGPLLNVLGGMGLLLLVAMAAYIAVVSIPQKLESL